jgi:hypothetical protein
MSLVSEPLPTDLDALRLFAENLQAELARKDREIAANAAEIYGIMYQPPPAKFGLYFTTHSGRKGENWSPRIGSSWRSTSCFLPLRAR